MDVTSEVEVVPEYLVHIKSEFLIENKKKSGLSQTDSTATGNSLSVLATEPESLKQESSEVSNSGSSDCAIEEPAAVGTTSDNVIKEGYKSNGYKIDDRDRRQNKKDYTGGGKGKNEDQNNSQGSKKRPRDSRPDSADRLCSYIARSIPCPWGVTCDYSHDPKEYLSRKQPDIGPICYQFVTFGECQNGIMCRYGSQHIDKETGMSVTRSDIDGGVVQRVIINTLLKDVQVQLRKKKYDFKNKNQTNSTINNIRKNSKNDNSNTKNVAAKLVEQDKTITEEQPSKKLKVEDEVENKQSHQSETTEVSSSDILKTNVDGDGISSSNSSSSSSCDVKVPSETVDPIIDTNTTTAIVDTKVTADIVQLVQQSILPPTLPPSLPPTLPATQQQAQQQPIQKKAESDFDFTPYPKFVKLVDFSNKVYVAPLTTVGNLPFRRVMKDFGADITCGEMAMSHNLVQGQASEWALLRRHSSEDCFGIQVAGGQPDHLSRIAKLLENETSSDFVDLNCGCPLDTICHRGCGAGLLNKPKKLVEIVDAMAKGLPSRQVTVKIRTGWDDKNPMAHKLIPMLQKCKSSKRIAAIMIHGRSRLQRYSKLANWAYVLEAAQSQDPSLPRIPIIGNGDIFCWDDWHGHCDAISTQVTGGGDFEDPEIVGLTSCAMLGRGALIKPWLPTEIKEKRSMDISATERLEMLKNFVNYGLEHWGSDTQGVTTTRRFLLEWLSFLHRYVPVGLTERIQRMQQRPPHFFGRCDLETLLGSSNSNDWVRISELLLGPVDDDFRFVAKHKSNSYAAEVGAVEVDESNG